MKLKIKKVTIDITEDEAIQIINGLNFGISDPDKPKNTNNAAYELKRLLMNNFQSARDGVHYIREKQ